MNEGREMNVELMGQQTYNQLPRNLKILIFNEAGGGNSFNHSLHFHSAKQKDKSFSFPSFRFISLNIITVNRLHRN